MCIAYIACLLSETDYTSCMHKKAITAFPTSHTFHFATCFHSLVQLTAQEGVVRFK